MTWEELLPTLIKGYEIVRGILALLGLMSLIAWAGFLYRGAELSAEAERRSAVCINSACDQPCKPGAKFQRHKGECK